MLNLRQPIKFWRLCTKWNVSFDVKIYNFVLFENLRRFFITLLVVSLRTFSNFVWQHVMYFTIANRRIHYHCVLYLLLRIFLCAIYWTCGRLCYIYLYVMRPRRFAVTSSFWQWSSPQTKINPYWNELSAPTVSKRSFSQYWQHTKTSVHKIVSWLPHK